MAGMPPSTGAWLEETSPRSATRPPTVPWMELVANSELSCDQTVLDYLYDRNHEVEGSGSAFFGGSDLMGMEGALLPEEGEEGESEGHR